MTDRKTDNPGQYKAVVSLAELEKMQAGEAFVIKLERDDHPTTEGTPYNKASVLPDALAVLLCPEIPDPTPADAFAALNARTAYESSDHPGCYYREVDGEQEWLNPPMVEGVAYRTTKRHNRKPVYTKFIKSGQLGTGTSWITIGKYDYISCRGMISSENATYGTFYNPLPAIHIDENYPDTVGTVWAAHRLQSDNIRIWISRNSTGSYTAGFIVEYTK